MMQIMFDHLERAPDLAPMAEAEQKVLLKALSKDPEQRYGSCREFIKEIEKAVVDELRETDAFYVEPAPRPEKQKTHAPADGMATMNLSGEASRTATSGELTPAMQTDAQGRPMRVWRSSDTVPLQEQAPPAARWPLVVGALLLAAGAGLAVVNWPGRQPSNSITRQDEPVLPAGCQKAEDAEVRSVNGRNYYSKIVMEKGGQRFTFLLIPYESSGDPSTFYMLEGKVTNDQFKAATSDEAFLAPLAKFEKAEPQLVRREWQQSFKGGGQLPAMYVTVTEAYCFAQWLGGNLPTMHQWNKAAGFDGQNLESGPFRKPVDGTRPKVAVGGLKSPVPVGQSEDDVSRFLCRDMAGNGVEFIRNLSPQTRGLVPAINPTKKDNVMVRGRSYSAPTPLRFEDLVDEGGESLPYFESDDVTSFRVVLELP
jgi:hypothetical protein